MSNFHYQAAPQAALRGSMRDFRVPKGPDLLSRVDGFYDWQDLRRQNGLWPFSRSTQSGLPAAISSANKHGSNVCSVRVRSGRARRSAGQV